MGKVISLSTREAQVLILILMEVPQWVNYKTYKTMAKFSVLILILMEVPQWALITIKTLQLWHKRVLILILMEVPQWAGQRPNRSGRNPS